MNLYNFKWMHRIQNKLKEFTRFQGILKNSIEFEGIQKNAKKFKGIKKSQVNSKTGVRLNSIVINFLLPSFNNIGNAAFLKFWISITIIISTFIIPFKLCYISLFLIVLHLGYILLTFFIEVGLNFSTIFVILSSKSWWT